MMGQFINWIFILIKVWLQNQGGFLEQRNAVLGKMEAVVRSDTVLHLKLRTRFFTKTCLCAIGLAALSAGSAFAQSSSSTAGTETLSNFNKVEGGMPQNTDAEPKTEKLSATTAEYINPNNIRKTRDSNPNSWDPLTLTRSAPTPQSSGLAVHIKRRPGNVNTSLSAAELLSPDSIVSIEETKTAISGDADIAAGAADSLRSPIKTTLFDFPAEENVNDSVFKLDFGEQLCLGRAEDCASNEQRQLDLAYARNLTSNDFGGLNLQLTPRAGLRFNDHRKSALVGALVKIGDDLREGSDMKSNTWYLFAGADAEAVTYSPKSVRSINKGEFHLQDRIIVGDAQAGLGYRLGDADLALTYFHRQATAENYSYDEEAAALSVTWRR